MRKSTELSAREDEENHGRKIGSTKQLERKDLPEEEGVARRTYGGKTPRGIEVLTHHHQSAWTKRLDVLETSLAEIQPLVDNAKTKPIRTPAGNLYMPPEVKKRLMKIKAALLSMTDEVESLFSNDAIELLVMKTEYLASTVNEMNGVLRGGNTINSGEELWDLLDRMIDVKYDFSKIIEKCNLSEAGEMRMMQVQKRVKAIEDRVLEKDGE